MKAEQPETVKINWTGVRKEEGQNVKPHQHQKEHLASEVENMCDSVR